MNRRYPDDINEEIIDQALDEIVSVFTPEWLSATDGHPLQTLWARQDALSTLELYTFGHALQVMNTINPKWVNGQVKQIKGTAVNRQGAFFEIIGLSFLASPHYTVKPAPHAQAGYDATISSNHSEARFSLKSYGRSKHERDFEEHCKQIETDILNIMEKSHFRYAEFYFVYDGTSSPAAEDWIQLKQELPKLLKRFIRSNNILNGVRIPLKSKVHNWRVWIFRTNRLAELDLSETSYKLLILSPYHFNEIRNLYDKLDAAQANFTKHVPANETTNIIYIHVPLSISVQQCVEWTNKYFEVNPSATAQVVIFYQCALTHDIDMGADSMTHTFKPVFNPNLPTTKELFNFTVPVGRTSTESSEVIFFSDEMKLPRENQSCYCYQRGIYYTKPSQSPQGGMQGKIRVLAPGVHEASVIELGGKKMILNGNFQPCDELLIL